MKITKNYLKQVIKEELEYLQEAEMPKIAGQIVVYNRNKIGIFIDPERVRPWNYAFTPQSYFEKPQNMRSITKEEFAELFGAEQRSDQEIASMIQAHGGDTAGD